MNMLSKKSGFTLLETMVAITILALVTTGSVVLATNVIKSAEVAKNSLVASYLAQEGIELVRNYRANNVFSGNAWLRVLSTSGGCNTANGCFMDFIGLSPSGCASGCPFLKFDDVRNIYIYGGSFPDSMFKRVIKVNPLSGTIEAKITSSVTWNDRFGSHTFSVEEFILNWQ